MVYQKVYILNVIVDTFYQYLPYIQNKLQKLLNMQNENNLRNKILLIKQDLVFK